MDYELFRKIVGKHIRKARKQMNIKTIDEMAEAAGLDEKNYGKNERGEKLPSTQTLYQLSQFISIDDVFKEVRKDLKNEEKQK